MKVVAFCALVFGTLLGNVLSENAFTELLRKCKVEEGEKLDKCLIQGSDSIRQIIKEGNNELDYKPQDPIVLKSVTLANADPSLTVSMEFTEFHLTGISEAVANKIKVDCANNEFILELHIANFKGHSPYILNVEFAGIDIPKDKEGEVTFNMEKVVFSLKANFSFVTGKLVFTNLENDYTFEAIQANLGNLFDDKPNAQAERAINVRAKLLIDKLKPKISKRLQEPVADILNGLFKTVKLEDIPCSDYSKKRYQKIYDLYEIE